MAQIGLTDPQPPLVLNEEKVRFALTTQYVYSALDSLDLCQFVSGPAWQLYDTEQIVEAVRLVTGWEAFTVEELLKLGQRRLNLLRAEHAREGIGREDGRLPRKVEQALTGGPTDGVKRDEVGGGQAKEMYYRRAGWDPATGRPTRETLESLGLG